MAKKFKPIDDNIDGDGEPESMTLSAGGKSVTLTGDIGKKMHDALDLVSGMGSISPLTEDDVIAAEREAKIMDKFFQEDWRWALCVATARAKIDACHKVWEDADAKTADLAHAHKKAHLFEEFIHILEDEPQKRADGLRMQLEEARKRGMPLLDAIEGGGGETEDEEEEVNEETGEVEE